MLALAILLMIVASLALIGTNKPQPTASNVYTTAVATNIPAVESGLLPWQLNSPLSRMVVEPGINPNQLVLIGGYTAPGSTSSSVSILDVGSGSTTSLGSLQTATHDASGSVINGSYFVFGGGNTTSISKVQNVNMNGTIQTLGDLPQPRSDSATAKIGNTTYIVGGYNSSSADSAILSTTDGRHFYTVAYLQIPVRYAAVVALNNLVYIFGGELINGSSAGQPTNAVQIYNSSTKSVSTASWTLPVPLEGATALNIGNQIYLAGGQSNVPESIQLGVGTTQVRGVNVSPQSLTYNSIWAVNANTGKFLNAGVLQVPVAYAGSSVLAATGWIIGGEYNGQVLSTVQMIKPDSSFGYAGNPGAGSPFYGGTLLIVDRGNNRLLAMNSTDTIKWMFPSSTTPQSVAKNFYFPDDAFFAKQGSLIISNQEDNNTIMEIAYPSGKVVWSYGHPKQAGSANGYLNTPDDAYLLKNGEVMVSDDVNCRILFINPNTSSVVGQIGQTGVCGHNAGHTLGAPNGDTPLLNGDVLVSEIWGSWVSEYTPAGNVVWSVQLPISYPSDPQQITIGSAPNSNPNRYMVMDYSNPGAILEFTRSGQVTWKYSVSSGPGRLDQPSLGELLPNNVYMINDDSRDRVVSIDRATGALVWQYGVNDTPGTSTGYLNTPDGFDYLTANNTTPTHPATL